MSLPTASKSFSSSLQQANRLFVKIAIDRCKNSRATLTKDNSFFISDRGQDILSQSSLESLWPIYSTSVSLFTPTLGKSAPTTYNPFTEPAEKFESPTTTDLEDSILRTKPGAQTINSSNNSEVLENWLVSTFLTLSAHSHIGNLTDSSMKFGIPSHIIHHLSKIPLDKQTIMINQGYFQLAWRFDSLSFWDALAEAISRNLDLKSPRSTKDEAALVGLAIEMFKDF